MNNFCDIDYFQLCGVVNGIGGPVSGIRIAYTVDGTTSTTTTDASGAYCIRVPRCASVEITANPLLGVTATPARYVFSPVCSDMPSLNFTLAPVVPPATPATITGIISSALGPVAGIAVNYTVNGMTASTVTGANGAYTISAPLGSDVVITPFAPAGTTLTPPSITIANVTGNTMGQNFMLSVAAGFSVVSGSVSGLPDNASRAVSYTVAGGAAATAITNAAGQYSFVVPTGATNVVITPPLVAGFTPAPANLTLAIVAADTPAQNFVYA